MSTGSHPERRTTFKPKYLPEPDETVLAWVGEYLRKVRGKRTNTDVAKAADVKPEVIHTIESGVIRQNLGLFRQILRQGYRLNLENVLAACFRTFEKKFNATGKRPIFNRDYYYSICLKNVGRHPPTPFLVGGDRDNFLWAVPMRRLKKFPLSVDLLELAPARVKNQTGATPGGSHDGVELIHVINGTVTVEIDTGEEDPKSRTLKREDSILFNSKREHWVANRGPMTSALLLIVRLPELA